MEVTETDSMACSFCDRKASDMRGSLFNRTGKAAICTDCIQICIEVLCDRGNIVTFKSVSSEGER